MKRRNFLEKSAFGFTGITSAALSTYFFSCGTDETARSKKEKDSRPNFLVIVSDDTGFADVGYHGSEIKTPNIDRLARAGVELDHFYVYPVCSPTRAAFLTGKTPDSGKDELFNISEDPYENMTWQKRIQIYSMN